MLGVMLRHNSIDSQQIQVERMKSREKAIQERRERIKEASKSNDNSGLFEKLLSITSIGVVINGLNKLYDQLEKNNVNDYESASKLLKRIDPSASEKDIDGILNLMEKNIKDFDINLLKNREMYYEYSEIQIDRLNEERKIQEEIAQSFNVSQKNEYNKELALENANYSLNR